MAEDYQTQSANINTSQPTVLKGLKLAQRNLETVKVAHPHDDSRLMTINKDDYDEGTHGPILKDKLPTRKKKVKKKAAKE